MRWILNAFYLDFLLLAAPYWLWKLPQARRYRAGLLERLGFVRRMRGGVRRLWIHAASVGEASVPQNLVALFREAHPDWEVVFSTLTDTGADRLRSLYPDCPVFYWPLDLSWCVAESLERVEPDAVLLVELEVWPNYLLSCRERGIPVAVTARIPSRFHQSFDFLISQVLAAAGIGVLRLPGHLSRKWLLGKWDDLRRGPHGCSPPPNEHSRKGPNSGKYRR